MMRFIQRAICGAKTFSGAHICSKLQNIIFATVEDQFDCKLCRCQTSVTAGTIFHGTRTPLVKWYWMIYHMAMDKVGVSVAEMQRLLDIRQYRTAWLMAHKIRKAMADRDAGYDLAGLVEMDDSFFGPKGTKQGRGSERKSVVLCAVMITFDPDTRETGFFKNPHQLPRWYRRYFWHLTMN
jgi:hypothetical protein